MKLEMTLEERPGFLHVIPIFDLFALLLLFFLLGPSLVLQSGIAVELPPSKFQMERFQETLVVTLGAGDTVDAEPRIYLGRDSVTLAELADRLERMRKEGLEAKTVVLLRTDAATPVGAERLVTELILENHFRVAMVGRAAAPSPTDPASDSAE